MKESIKVLYHIECSAGEVHEKAQDICIEQTVETTRQLITDEWIRESIVGHVEEVKESSMGGFDAVICYNPLLVDGNLTGLLNVLYGNTSLKRGIAIRDVQFPGSLLTSFRGPRFGIQGLRELTGVKARPLLAAPLKPLGTSPEELGALCYELAAGGIDIIKDDHGLADHSFCPFRERVNRVMEAIDRAAQETGKRALYFPCVMGAHQTLEKRVLYAKEQGAGGLLLAPMLTGIDYMRSLAEDDSLALPLMAHPALMGLFFSSENHGISHAVVLGRLMRMAGADMVIYPGAGGRFPFTEDECLAIKEALHESFSGLRPSFPVPAGGLSLSSLPGQRALFGNDVIFLMGSNLFTHSGSIRESARAFLQSVEPPQAPNKTE